jgi:hypothetical protein
MTINTSKSIFFKHQKELENNLACKISSAIFAFAYNKVKGINTELIFLDYWSIKNKYNIPKCFLILRNLDGELVSKFNYNLKKGASNSIDLKNLIPKNILLNLEEKSNSFNFVGSIEIKFISEVDLKVAYPAVICRYYSDKWHTTFHSSQRIMSYQSGDLIQENNIVEINEGNMLIDPNEDVETILIITNGTKKVESQIGQLLIEGNNEKINLKFELPNLKPFQTYFLEINKIIKANSQITQNQHYYATVKFNISNDIFPRMIYGYCDKKNGELSLDHTNFGKSNNSDSDTFHSSSKSYNMLYSLPSTPWNDVSTSIALPPSYPDGKYKLKINSLNNKIKKNYILTRETKSRFKLKKDILPCTLSFEKDILPRRFHTVFMYKVNSSRLSNFFTDGPYPRDSRMPGFRWAPFWLRENQSFIQISPRSFSFQEKKKINIFLKIYSERGYEGESLISIENNNDFLIDQKFFKERFKNIEKSIKILWLTFSYDKENNIPVFHYISRRKNSICVDHAF